MKLSDAFDPKVPAFLRAAKFVRFLESIAGVQLTARTQAIVSHLLGLNSRNLPMWLILDEDYHPAIAYDFPNPLALKTPLFLNTEQEFSFITKFGTLTVEQAAAIRELDDCYLVFLGLIDPQAIFSSEADYRAAMALFDGVFPATHLGSAEHDSRTVEVIAEENHGIPEEITQEYYALKSIFEGACGIVMHTAFPAA